MVKNYRILAARNDDGKWFVQGASFTGDQLRYWEVETADFKEFSFGSLNSALKFEEVKLALLENRIKIVLGKYPEKNWEYLISFFTFEDRTFLLIRDPEDCSRSSSVEL